MKTWLSGLLAGIALLSATLAEASLIIHLHVVGSNRSLGTVTADDTIYGVLFTPHLHGVAYGTHGFHVHQGVSCGNYGCAAGGHYDPVRTYQHNGPYDGNGHLGDLPVLPVNARGRASLPVLAPRLKLSDIAGHTLVIDSGSDNYTDVPKRDGGGGAILACGVIPYH